MDINKLCINLLLLTEILHAASNQTFNQKKFTEYANQYGNKTANLRELESVVKEINSDNKIETTFAVPRFFGVSHQEVVDYLKSVKNVDGNKTIYDLISAKWKEFIKGQPKGKTTITPSAEKALRNIRALVRKAFKEQFNIGENGKSGFQNFIQDAQNDLLMVRSTGREDSKELSNAGGNESISSVKPDIVDISKAMGEVIASYFGEKSIGQRLALKDPAIHDAPFMPVLLQVMIGEPAGGDNKVIPISGVMFRPEAEGKIPGVTAIQATWGHNEAVVNGLVPVDTFYIGRSDLIHPVVRIKPNRLVTASSAFSSSSSSSSSSSTNATSTAQAGLVLKDNPKHLQQIPCLTKRYIFDLNAGAQIIKNYYNYAVDIEFVIFKNIIYLVQVRPLEDQKINPSYIKPEALEGIPANKVVRGTSIGVGGGSVRTIENPKAVLVEETIRGALSNFLARNDKDAIQAVIVNQMAPATSHEATIFRANNKPVIYVSDLTVIKGWVNGSQFPLFVDPQQELIVPFAALKVQQDVVDKGWYSHPIPKRVSLFSVFISQFNKTILETLRPEEFFKGVKTTQLIRELKTADKEEAIKALRSILHRVNYAIYTAEKKQQELKGIHKYGMKTGTVYDFKLYEKIYKTANRPMPSKMKFGAQTSSTVIKDLEQLFLHLINCAIEYHLIITSSHDQLEKLYALTFIEALIRQMPEPLEIVNSYSLLSVLKTEKQEQELVKKLNITKGSLRPFIVQYAKAGTFALTEELDKAWNSFLRRLARVNKNESDITLQSKFAQMINTIAKLDLMPLWLNVSFAAHKDTRDSTDAKKTAESLVKEYDQSIDFIKKLENMKRLIDGIDIENWSKPQLFNKQMKNFSQTTLSYFTSQEFIQQYEKSGTIGKLAATSVMSYLVEIFDTSIKTLKGSRSYSSTEELVKNFERMLDNYFGLFGQWGKFTFIKNKRIGGYTIEDYIKFGNNVYTESLNRNQYNKSQLRPSGILSVSSVTFGSGAEINRSLKGEAELASLEDIFSFVHQNILVIVSMLLNNSASLMLPQNVQIATKNLNNIGANKIGASLTKKELTLFFNKTLRNHSSTMQIRYPLDQKSIYLSVQIIGVSDANRWPFIGGMVSVISEILQLSLSSKPKIEVRGDAATLSFTWNLTSEDQIIKAIKFLNSQMKVTFKEWAESTNMLLILMKDAGVSPENTIVMLLKQMEKLALETKILIFVGLVAQDLVRTEDLVDIIIKNFEEFGPMVQQFLLFSFLSYWKRPNFSAVKKNIRVILEKAKQPTSLEGILLYMSNGIAYFDKKQLSTDQFLKVLSSSINFIKEREKSEYKIDRALTNSLSHFPFQKLSQEEKNKLIDRLLSLSSEAGPIVTKMIVIGLSDKKLSKKQGVKLNKVLKGIKFPKEITELGGYLDMYTNLLSNKNVTLDKIVFLIDVVSKKILELAKLKNLNLDQPSLVEKFGSLLASLASYKEYGDLVFDQFIKHQKLLKKHGDPTNIFNNLIKHTLPNEKIDTLLQYIININKAYNSAVALKLFIENSNVQNLLTILNRIITIVDNTKDVDNNKKSTYSFVLSRQLSERAKNNKDLLPIAKKLQEWKPSNPKFLNEYLKHHSSDASSSSK